MILLYTSILPITQLQIQQMMTSQIRSHMKYFTQIYYILMLILMVKIKNFALMTVFNTI